MAVDSVELGRLDEAIAIQCISFAALLKYARVHNRDGYCV
jgi:hypothetical protein